MKNIISVTKIIFFCFYFVFYLNTAYGLKVDEAMFEIQQKTTTILVYYGYDILDSNSSNYSIKKYYKNDNCITIIEGNQYF